MQHRRLVLQERVRPLHRPLRGRTLRLLRLGRLLRLDRTVRLPRRGGRRPLASPLITFRRRRRVPARTHRPARLRSLRDRLLWIPDRRLRRLLLGRPQVPRRCALGCAALGRLGERAPAVGRGTRGDLRRPRRQEEAAAQGRAAARVAVEARLRLVDAGTGIAGGVRRTSGGLLRLGLGVFFEAGRRGSGEARGRRVV